MKYLVYKITGGLSHMLFQINSCIELSKVTGRHLIIDTYYGSFQQDFNDYFEIPNFEYSTNYDIVADKTGIQKYIDGHAEWVTHLDIRLDDINLSKSSDEIINSTDDFVFCTLVNDIPNFELEYIKQVQLNIKLKKEIVDTVKVNSPMFEYVGFHYRNTDLTNDLDSLVNEVIKFENKNIYFSTDDFYSYDNLKNKLGDSYNIIQYVKPPKLKEGQGNIHYLADDSHLMILNTLVDMYHLIHATHFVSSPNSMFSKMVLKLRENDNFFK